MNVFWKIFVRKSVFDQYFYLHDLSVFVLRYRTVMRNFALSVSIILLLQIFVFAQKQNQKVTDTIDGLQLSITFGDKKETYRPNENFKIKIKLTNISKNQIVIYKNMGWGWSSSLFLAVSDKNGKSLISGILPDAQDPPPYSKEDFIALQPKDFFEIETFIPLVNYKIKTSGIYRIIVWYQSPISKQFVPQEADVFTMEQGRLESKPLQFNVTKLYP